MIPSRQSEPALPNAQDSTRSQIVWLQLVDLFGNAFFREHGDAPGPLWQAAIMKFTDAQIARGLNDLAEQGLAFPANLPQFVAACTATDASSAPCWNQPKLAAPTDHEAKENVNKAWNHMEKLAGKTLRPPENTE